ncbi:DNA primase [Kerstersia gyiorum]|uniref:type VI secretion system-associated protein TagO n=1 Tax=Kerstersia gyiorum TaxID=206506 RepID=UPI00107089D8|nr:type VI secretion system-associated protein TagO [Kerstersia gyiorum]QBR40981.1 DNA primase [Kerstersia gyiorum]
MKTIAIASVVAAVILAGCGEEKAGQGKVAEKQDSPAPEAVVTQESQVPAAKTIDEKSVPGKSYAECVIIQNSVSRLACFDALAVKFDLAPAVKPDARQGMGDWIVSEKINPLDDTAVYFAVIDAQTGRSRRGDKISMVVRCANNRTEMYINWHDYLGMDSTQVTYRVGKNAAVRQAWSLSTDNQSTFFPGSPVSVLKQMVEETSFVASLVPYNENPVTVEFDITGIEPALQNIRKNCDW